MVFNSAQFLLFLPLAALGYFAVPQKARRVWLLLACYFFYFCWNPAHVRVRRRHVPPLTTSATACCC